MTAGAELQGAGVRERDLSDGILRIELDRSAKANALDGVTARALARAIASASARPAVRLIQIGGAGKHFCAGGDLGGDEPPGTDRGADFIGLLETLDACERPLIACVRGACIGIGLALASRCDAIIASENAFFALPEVRLGIGPGPLLPYFVAALGTRGFRRYGLSGERMNAHDAARLGLVHHVASDHELEAMAAAVSSAFLVAPAAAFASWKRAALGQRPPV